MYLFKILSFFIVLIAVNLSKRRDTLILSISFFLLIIARYLYLDLDESKDIYRYNIFLENANEYDLLELFSITGWEPGSLMVMKMFSVVSSSAYSFLFLLVVISFLICYWIKKDWLIAYLCTSPVLVGSLVYGSLRMLIGFVVFLLALNFSKLIFKYLLYIVSAITHKVFSLLIIFSVIFKWPKFGYILIGFILIFTYIYFDRDVAELLVGDRVELLEETRVIPTAFMPIPILLYTYSLRIKGVARFISFGLLLIIFLHPFITILSVFLRFSSLAVVYLLLTQNYSKLFIKNFAILSLILELIYFVLPYSSQLCYYTGSDFCSF